MITVYGVFIKDRCIYVGRTSDLDTRSTAHTLRFRKLFNDEPVVRPLKTVCLESSAQVEWSMIRLYKDLGQADFNAEPGFVYSPPRFEPKSQRCKERAAKILELVHQGHPRKEIAQLLQVAESEISKVCRSNNLWALPGQKKGGGKGYGRKLMRSQYEEILRRDDKDESHADIGKLFGVSRERIRQICKAAGHPDRRDRAKRVTASQREAARVERQRIRALKKITPTRMALAFADLWKEGKTLGEIAVAMGRTRGSMGVKLVRCRKRYPSLFPYRYAGWERRIQQQKEAA